MIDIVPEGNVPHANRALTVSYLDKLNDNSIRQRLWKFKKCIFDNQNPNESFV